ncbi:MAG: radical SAM family heme chaperone HemW [Clostridiales bacterium]|nr:radical SAM family heme chaperone HemW [Clostridiales bacterium]
MELYVHIPFCRQKCRYCAFASFAGQESYREKYIELLLTEARNRKQEVSGSVSTVYIGGGTPSLLSPSQLSVLIAGLREVFDLDGVTEFTSEANPGTVTGEWLDAAVSCGVSRVSFGMQAYQENLLRLLGRIHTFEDVRTCVHLARKAGISNISLDLIFGIPGQTGEDWNNTLDAALSLDPSHISAYGLIPEEGTPLMHDLNAGRLTLPDPDLERNMYSLACEKTALSGFHQYEISSFARENRECVHNIGYWTQVPYLGLGVSAASMTGISFSDEGMTYFRSVNPDTITVYEQQVLSGITPEAERISPSDARFETVMLGLRMNRGVSERDFYRIHGVTIGSCFGGKLETLKKRGLMLHEGDAWKLTARGFDIQNSVLVELMEE